MALIQFPLCCDHFYTNLDLYVNSLSIFIFSKHKMNDGVYCIITFDQCRIKNLNPKDNGVKIRCLDQQCNSLDSEDLDYATQAVESHFWIFIFLLWHLEQLGVKHICYSEKEFS